MIYLPTFTCEWTLSRWAGRPQGLSIDPMGVECFQPQPEPKRGLFGRRRPAPLTSPYLHVLVHREQAEDRVRSWAIGQLARLTVLSNTPDATGEDLTRLAEVEAHRLSEHWQASTMVVAGRECSASVCSVSAELWAAYVERADEKIALVGRDIQLVDAHLRPASVEETQSLVQAALRV